MSGTLHGIIHGKTIELDNDLGMSAGRDIEVQVQVVLNSCRSTGEGFLRTEGALANDLEWDAIIEEIYVARKEIRRPRVRDLERA